MKERLQGVIANIPMCFTPDWTMDQTALRKNIRAYRDEGLEAMYLLGTSGELVQRPLRKSIGEPCGSSSRRRARRR